MASFAIIVRSSSLNMQSAWSALRFCEEAAAAHHRIVRVFFHGDGTDIALTNRVFPQNEVSLLSRWESFAQKSGTPLIVCISSALKRGILDDNEARRYQKHPTMSPFMEIGGLGQLVEASSLADRVVSFHD